MEAAFFVFSLDKETDLVEYVNKIVNHQFVIVKMEKDTYNRTKYRTREDAFKQCQSK